MSGPLCECPFCLARRAAGEPDYAHGDSVEIPADDADAAFRALLDENERLRDELGEAKIQIEELADVRAILWSSGAPNAEPLKERLEAARAEVARLRAALKTYGHHLGCPDGPDPYTVKECARWVSRPSNDTGMGLDNSKLCTCGLDAALAGLGEAT